MLTRDLIFDLMIEMQYAKFLYNDIYGILTIEDIDFTYEDADIVNIITNIAEEVIIHIDEEGYIENIEVVSLDDNKSLTVEILR